MSTSNQEVANMKAPVSNVQRLEDSIVSLGEINARVTNLVNRVQGQDAPPPPPPTTGADLTPMPCVLNLLAMGPERIHDVISKFHAQMDELEHMLS